MATSGTNYTVKWTLSNGVLTISPTSGNSGIARKDWGLTTKLVDWITLTADEVSSVQSIIFVGDIQFYIKDLGESSYSKSTGLTSFLFNFTNASEIDVSGLNTTGVESFRLFFPKSLTILTGLSLMDVASGKDFSNMFYGAKLESLDLSTFPLNSADNISRMLDDLLYCQTVKLPSNFSRKFAALSEYSGEPIYSFGLAKVPTTKNGITVTSDEDFFKLDSAQGGTWVRDISGSANLSFQVKSTSREANIATVNYQYATSTATMSIYLKKASESSFPSTASKTVTISGTGSGSVNIELATDDAYDIKIVASDGNTSIYLYPSVGSNVLLFEVDEQGNINVSRDLRTKGDLHTEGDADVSGSLRASGDVYTEGNIDISGDITTGGDVHAVEKTGYFEELFVHCNTNPSGGKKIGENKVLWSGAWFMDASHTATLSEKVTEQLTGIVLVWSYYTNGAAQDYGWHTFFVPKMMVQLKSGVGYDIPLRRDKNATFGTKYVYVNDAYIKGHANNVATGTANNVPYANNKWVLRYVFGC